MTILSSRTVRVSLMGVPTIQDGNRKPLVLGLAGSTLELFSYLLNSAGRPVRRDHLTDVIWDSVGEFRARSALNTAIWRVRQYLLKFHGFSLNSSSTMVRLDTTSHVILDTHELQSAVDAAISDFSKDNGLPVEVRKQLAKVLTNQNGEFLESLSSNWVLVERQHMLNLQIRGMSMLMQDLGLRGLYEDAIQYGHRIIALDPYRESVHCQMLWLLMMTCRRADAIRHYRNYQTMLKQELNIEPMAETKAVFDMVCADEKMITLDSVDVATADPCIGADQRLSDISLRRRAFYRSHFTPGG